jgi:hypothetical protein
MSDQHKLEILRSISSGLTAGESGRLNFSSLVKTVGLSKQDLDKFLTELNKGRFISQYAKKGVDSFTFIVNQKGFDAVEDQSFI